MTDELTQYIGKQIRHYRKARGLTIKELAEKIHKSKGSVSKYESGQITLDIVTVFSLAEVLQIELNHLVNYPMAHLAAQKNNRNPFKEHNVLYLYHMRSSLVFKSVIHLQPEAEKIYATLFYRVADLADAHNCKCIYEGEMYCHDTILCFTLQNFLNPVENLLLNFTIPAKYFSTLTGFISGLGANTLVPACFIGVLSPDPLAETDELKLKLKVPKESLVELKKRNIFYCLPELGEL